MEIPPKEKSDIEAKRAWIITWEGTSEVTEEPVAILNSRMSAGSVKDLVELLYVSLTYSPQDKLLFAKNRKANAYPASMTLFQRINCGHNPFLYARLVSKLKVVGGTLTWTEPPSETERQSKILRQ